MKGGKCELSATLVGDEVSFFPLGNPARLAVSLEDFVANLANGKATNVEYNPATQFACSGPCKAHFTIAFGRVTRLGWDDSGFANDMLRYLKRIVASRDLLMCAVGAPHSTFRHRPDGTFEELP